MKKSLLLAVSTILTSSAALADACPALEGRYDCSGYAADFSGSLDITRSAAADGSIEYYLPFVARRDNPTYNHVVADGKDYVYPTSQGDSIKKTVCKDRMVEITRSTPAMASIERTQVTQESDGRLTVTTRLSVLNKTFPANTSVCTR